MSIATIAFAAIVPVIVRYLFARHFFTEEQQKPLIPGVTGAIIPLPGLALIILFSFMYEPYIKDANQDLVFGLLILFASSLLAHTLWRPRKYRFHLGIKITAAVAIVVSSLGFVLAGEWYKPGALQILAVGFIGFELGLVLGGLKVKADDEKAKRQGLFGSDRA